MRISDGNIACKQTVMLLAHFQGSRVAEPKQRNRLKSRNSDSFQQDYKLYVVQVMTWLCLVLPSSRQY